MKKIIYLVLILLIVSILSCRSGDSGTDVSSQKETYDWMIPKITSSFLFATDDGVMNMYAYDLGFNTYSFIEPSWKDIEKIRGKYIFNDEQLTYLINYKGNKIIRLSLFDCLWNKRAVESSLNQWMIELLFTQSTVPEDYSEGYPLKLSEEFLESYFNFFGTTLGYLKSKNIKFDLILLEMEFNSWVVSTRYGNSEGVRYLKQLTAIVKKYYPNTHVGIILATTELSSGYVENPGEFDRLGICQFVEKMIDAEVYFDTICFRFTPDIYENVPASKYEDFVNQLSQYNKYLYVWTAWFTADSTNTAARYTHNEQTQKDEIIDFMKVSISNPLFLGVNIPIFDYVEILPDKNILFQIGLVKATFEEQSNPDLTVRPSYNALKDFWLLNHPK